MSGNNRSFNCFSRPVFFVLLYSDRYIADFFGLAGNFYPRAPSGPRPFAVGELVREALSPLVRDVRPPPGALPGDHGLAPWGFI